LLEADKAKLEQVASAQISYGHSDGRSRPRSNSSKGDDRKQVVKSLAFPTSRWQWSQCRHRAPHLPGRIRTRGKATTTRIGALQVWQKQDGGWKLLARQGSGCRHKPEERRGFVEERHGFAGERRTLGVWGHFVAPMSLEGRMTCAEKRSSCSRITASGVPTAGRR